MTDALRHLMVGAVSWAHFRKEPWQSEGQRIGNVDRSMHAYAAAVPGHSRSCCDVRTIWLGTYPPGFDMPAKTNRPVVELSARDEQFSHSCHTGGMSHLDAKRQNLTLTEEVCLKLFDRWCERRNVLALAYLMHGWPLANDTPSLATRLLQSLRELKEHHPEVLLSEERALLGLILTVE